jgi:hypothetical protein
MNSPMDGYGIVIVIHLLWPFSPFLISLFGIKVFAILAFLGSCLAFWAELLSISSGLGSGPPDPPEELKHAIMFYVPWLTAWVCAAIGVGLKLRKWLQLRPARASRLPKSRQLRRGVRNLYWHHHRHN